MQPKLLALQEKYKADFIMANPPFNLSNWGAEQLKEAEGNITKKQEVKIDFLFFNVFNK